MSPGQQQHVEMYRKVLLRKRLLRWSESGAAYVPFIGDGDIAEKLYSDRMVYGADLDAGRCEVARLRLPNSIVEVADCNGWPFRDLEDKIAIADFDAYVDPYEGFRAFWAKHENKARRLVVFFTDGRRMGLMRSGSWTRPDGSKSTLVGKQKHPIFNAYLSRHVWPWFYSHVAPWRVLDIFRYQRAMMVYWGAVLEAPSDEVPKGPARGVSRASP